VIVPKFNKGRIARSDAIGNTIKTLGTPIAKTRDMIVNKAVGAANKEMIAKQRAAEKAYAKKQKAKKLQEKVAKSYIVTPKKGQTLTTAQQKQNAAAASYMGYSPTKVSVKVKSSAGRPNTKAGQKTKLPTAPKLPKPTVNKTAPRKGKPPIKKVAAVTKPKAPAAPGRRKNGAPK